VRPWVTCPTCSITGITGAGFQFQGRGLRSGSGPPLAAIMWSCPGAVGTYLGLDIRAATMLIIKIPIAKTSLFGFILCFSPFLPYLIRPRGLEYRTKIQLTLGRPFFTTMMDP
jgi:hypothetical protein